MADTSIETRQLLLGNRAVCTLDFDPRIGAAISIDHGFKIQRADKERYENALRLPRRGEKNIVRGFFFRELVARVLDSIDVVSLSKRSIAQNERFYFEFRPRKVRFEKKSLRSLSSRSSSRYVVRTENPARNTRS